MKELYRDYIRSVYDLADKLPQWSSEYYDRRVKAAVSSLFEEAGEISGLFSKYCTRTTKEGIDLYTTTISDIPEEKLNEIKSKFTDEVGDFLWVLTASCHALVESDIDIFDIFDNVKDDYQNAISFSDSLFDLFGSIYVLYSSLNLGDRVILTCLIDIVYLFGVFILTLHKQYNIELDDIIKNNMEKLGFRYDENGKRVDGKL